MPSVNIDLYEVKVGRVGRSIVCFAGTEDGCLALGFFSQLKRTGGPTAVRACN